jgi:phenylalanyl-tRNA synthetase beta chain
MVVRASDRAAALLAELAGGQVASGVLDVYPAPVPAPEISLDPARANALLGLDLTPEVMAELLGRLGMEVEAVKGEIRARAPSWRPDLTLDVDLVEEVARLHGYDGIPTTLPAAPIEPAQEPTDRRVEKVAREVYTALGFHEAITYRFIASDWPDRLRLGAEDLRRRLVRLQNPLREDQAVMRTSLLPGLLSAAQYNHRRDQANVRLFEVGKVFFDRAGDELPEEREAVAGILLGEGEPGYWGRGVAVDFYHAKGVVQSLLDHLLIRDARFSSEGASPCLHPGVSTRLIWEKVLLGEVGRINPEVALALELPENLYLMDLDAGGGRGGRAARSHPEHPGRALPDRPAGGPGFRRLPGGGCPAGKEERGAPSFLPGRRANAHGRGGGRLPGSGSFTTHCGSGCRAEDLNGITAKRFLRTHSLSLLQRRTV